MNLRSLIPVLAVLAAALANPHVVLAQSQGMDVFSFTVTWWGLGVFILLVAIAVGVIVGIVIWFFNTQHQHAVDDRFLNNSTRQLEASITAQQNMQQQFANYQQWYMQYQTQVHNDNMELRREYLSMTRDFMDKMYQLWQMWVQSSIMASQKTTDAMARWLDVSTIALLWQLIQNGMYIEDVLQLIGINATTDQIAKLIELLNKVGVYPASRLVTPPVQVIEYPPTGQSTQQSTTQVK